MRHRIDRISDTFLVAKSDGLLAGCIVGSALFRPYLTHDLFYEVVEKAEQEDLIALTSLPIAKECQGQGVGTALIAALKDVAVAQNHQGITLTCHDYLIAY